MTINHAIKNFLQRVEDALVDGRVCERERIQQLLQNEEAADLIRAYGRRLSYRDKSLTPLDWLNILFSCFWQRVSRVKPKSPKDLPIYFRAQLKWSAGDALRQHLKGTGPRSKKVRLIASDVHGFQLDAIHQKPHLGPTLGSVASESSSKLVSPHDADLATFELHELKLCIFDQIHHNFRDGKRDILMLHFLYDLPPGEVAVRVGTTAHWVRSVLRTNLPQLQRLVAERCLGG